MRRALAILLMSLVPAGAARADVGGPDIVAFLNAQRAAQGIPAGIVEDPALSDGCAKHNHYGFLNGGLTHDEQKGRPGYTEEGRTAAAAAILYQGDTWTAAANPFETAPIHLHQALAPRLDRMGAYESEGYGCATTLASRTRAAPPADVTYTYPGDGAAGWVRSQVASEGPYTPGEEVGIPAGTETGPYLYVMFDGPDVGLSDAATATGASLTGPAGPVPLVTADNTTPGLEGYLPVGMEIIPRSALAPRTTYTATAAANVTTGDGTGAARPFARTWSFTTRALANAVKLSGLTAAGRRVTVKASSTAPVATAAATLGTVSASAALTDGRTRLDLPADGAWRVCVRSGGDATAYDAAQDCGTVTVRQAAAKGAFETRFRHRRRTVSVTVTAGVDLTAAVTVRGGGTLLATSPATAVAAGASRRFSTRLPRPLRRAKLKVTVVAGGRRSVVRRTVKLG